VPAQTDARVRDLIELRRAAERAPDDLASALKLARAHIEAARREGDPRELGAAEATLLPFASRTDQSPELRVLRATILQARHDFDGALQELGLALQQTPNDLQALLTSATVWTVQGGYAEARANCATFAQFASPAFSAACSAPIDALTGNAQRARTDLERELERTREASERSLLVSLLAEQTYWTGDWTRAGQHFERAITLDPGDRYTRALYADLLLDQGKSGVAYQLVAAYSSDDALSLRAALAAHRLGRADAATRLARLQQGFRESRLRGDTMHMREEARVWLALGDGARALDCALESWAVQREAWDARLVLEAAQQSAQPARAMPVLTWLRDTGFESPYLRQLAARLGPSS
jgi:tetratricopeptide (TPR) repeat protein